MYPSTPTQALIGKVGLIPARILLNHRQRVYAYYLLILPDDYLIKRVFFISSRNKDTNIVQVEDQLEDTLIWAGSKS